MSRSIGGYLNDLLDGKKSKQETVTLLQKQREKFVAKKVKEARVDAIKSYKKVKEARKQTASDIFSLAHEYAQKDDTIFDFEELYNYYYHNVIHKIGEFDDR